MFKIWNYGNGPIIYDVLCASRPITNRLGHLTNQSRFTERRGLERLNHITASNESFENRGDIKRIF